MVDSANPPIRYAICTALLSGLVAGMFVIDVGARVQSRDDWRRTVHGWEHNDRWLSAARTRQSFEPPRAYAKGFAHNGRRTDAHPAALALAQLVGSMLALAIFSPRGRSMLSETSLTAILARSFRASVFGS
jgi:hypothetical protein